MKAIIMAGGEGTRLHPITTNLPKPMVQLFDKPIMEHIINLLKQHGITEIGVTLQFMPNSIRDYFRSGEDFGVSISYFTEHAPLGTAGGVRACADFIKNDDFLVISGDAVLDLDLTKAVALHNEKDADVTVLLYRHPTPLEYGLAMTNAEGQIERFIEKPSWSQVFTDTINTGIYIIKADILKEIPPDMQYDFAKDLFPKLLSAERKLYGFTLEGYWCDMGDPAAYLQCSCDALSGQVALEFNSESSVGGVFSSSSISNDVRIISPVYIGEDVQIGEGSVIGPFTTLESGTIIGKNVEIANSIIQKSQISDHTKIERAIVSRACIIGKNVRIEPDTVFGEHIFIGDNSFIQSGVRIAPHINLASGSFIKDNIVSAVALSSFSFDENGTVSGVFGVDITPEFLLALGSSAVSIGSRIAVGYQDNALLEMVGSTLISGLLSSGAQVTQVDTPLPNVAAFISRNYLFNLSIFVAANGNKITLHFFDKTGLPIPRPIQRKIESEFSRGEFFRVESSNIKAKNIIKGTSEAYIATISRLIPQNKLSVSVMGSSPASTLLSKIFTISGIKTTSPRIGVPSFEISASGNALSIVDEVGIVVPEDYVLPLVALCFFKNGGSEFPVFYSAPTILEAIASNFGGKILRTTRDGTYATNLLSRNPNSYDPFFGAATILAYMAKSNQEINELLSEIPTFSIVSCEVKLTGDRGAVMRAISDSCSGFHRELYEGLRICSDAGWVLVSPLSSKNALKIISEGANEEIACELCALFEKKTKDFDVK